MKRINIAYDGKMYSIGNRDLDDLRAEIVAAVTSPQPSWLEVNDGEGAVQPAHLLLSPSTSIVLIPIPDPEGDSDSAAPR